MLYMYSERSHLQEQQRLQEIEIMGLQQLGELLLLLELVDLVLDEEMVGVLVLVLQVVIEPMVQPLQYLIKLHEVLPLEGMVGLVRIQQVQAVQPQVTHNERFTIRSIPFQTLFKLLQCRQEFYPLLNIED